MLFTSGRVSTQVVSELLHDGTERSAGNVVLMQSEFPDIVVVVPIIIVAAPRLTLLTLRISSTLLLLPLVLVQQALGLCVHFHLKFTD